jgi:hypothetical protein
MTRYSWMASGEMLVMPPETSAPRPPCPWSLLSKPVHEEVARAAAHAVGGRAAGRAGELVGHGAGQQVDELVGVAVLQRVVLPDVAVQELRDARLRRLRELLAARDDSHGLGRDADGQLNVLRDDLGDRQDNLLDLRGAEAGGFDLDGVGADGQRGEPVEAGVGGLRGGRDVGGHVGRRDSGAGNDRAVRVGDRARQRRGALREGRRAQGGDEQRGGRH